MNNNNTLLILILIGNLNLIFSQEKSIQVNDRYRPGVIDIRTYQLYLPQNYTPDKKYPLIIGIHGYSETGIRFANNSQWPLKQETEDFILVCPNGINNSWNLIVPVELTNYYTDDINFISALIDSTCNNYSIDPLRIYVTGHSRGGFFAYRLAYELSDKIAAIAPTAAKLTFYNFELENPVPLIHFHSLNDSTVYYRSFYHLGYYYFASVDSMMQIWADKNNCELIPDTIYNNTGIIGKKWKAITGNGDVELYVAPNAGHSYPTPQRIGISSVDIIWNFFMEHPKQGENTDTSKNYREHLRIFPNPVQNTLQFEIPDLLQKEVNYKITDLNGQLLQQGRITGNTLDVSKIDMGTYLLNIDVNGKKLSRKFIIK